MPVLKGASTSLVIAISSSVEYQPKGDFEEVSIVMMPDSKKLPKPGPAKLSKSGYNDVDEWLKCAFNNQYLPEPVMKKLCEICKEYLMEGLSLVQYY